MTCRRHRDWRGPGACPFCLHDRLLVVAAAAAAREAIPSASSGEEASDPPPAGGRSGSFKFASFSLFPALLRSRRNRARSNWSWISAVFLGRGKKSKRSLRLFSLEDDSAAAAAGGGGDRRVARGMSPADGDHDCVGSPSLESSARVSRRAARRRWRSAAAAVAGSRRGSFAGLGAWLKPVVRVGYETNRVRVWSGRKTCGPSRTASVFSANRSRKLRDIGGHT